MYTALSTASTLYPRDSRYLAHVPFALMSQSHVSTASSTDSYTCTRPKCVARAAASATGNHCKPCRFDPSARIGPGTAVDGASTFHRTDEREKRQALGLTFEPVPLSFSALGGSNYIPPRPPRPQGQFARDQPIPLRPPPPPPSSRSKTLYSQPSAAISLSPSLGSQSTDNRFVAEKITTEDLDNGFPVQPRSPSRMGWL